MPEAAAGENIGRACLQAQTLMSEQGLHGGSGSRGADWLESGQGRGRMREEDAEKRGGLELGSLCITFFSERALDSGREVSQVVLCRVALPCSGLGSMRRRRAESHTAWQECCSDGRSVAVICKGGDKA